MNKLTTIKRHNIIVVGLSVLVAASFWIFPFGKNKDTIYSYRTYKTPNGYGYDILVNDSIKIHQDFIPVLAEKKGFAEEQQAIKAARLVIEKLKAGINPAITREELHKIE